MRCRGCDLYEYATQTVFGEGSARARMMLVGEQPGDHEDRLGHPFVGPAGKLLDRALEEAGIDRRNVYLTNAVKHFKFFERGKRRIHVKPKTIEIRACKPWLDAELEVVNPSLIVVLGATAAQSLLGSSFRLLANRGRVIADLLPTPVLATIHPSAILRAVDDKARHREMGKFVEDLIAARAAV
jgi:uracil-DNA glycosylase